MAVRKNGVAVLTDTGILPLAQVGNVPNHVEVLSFAVANCGSVLQVSRTKTGNNVAFTLTLAGANCNCVCN